MRYKKLLLALALSGFATQSHATYPDLNSMLQNFAPDAPTRAPELNSLIISINGLAPYPQLQQDALLTLVPLADGSLRAAADAPMRQVLSVISERLLAVDMREETGYAAGDEPADFEKTDTTAKDLILEAVNKNHKSETHTANTQKLVNEPHKTENAKASTSSIEKSEKSEKSEKPKDELATKHEKADKHEKDKKVEDSKTENDPKFDDIGTSTSSSLYSSSSSDEVKIPDLTCAPKINAVWGQLLGDAVTQNERSSLPGYRADVLGGVIGRDLFMAPNMVAGVAGGYQHARVTQHELSGSYLNINRYQLTAYGRYHLCDWPIYLLGVVTAATDRYENCRYILVPPVSGIGYSVIANSEFSGWESNAYLESGYVWKCGNFRAVPKLMLMFSHLDINSYDESDALALDLTVKYQDMDELRLGAGAKFDYRNRFEKAYVIPEVHAYMFHDFMNDAQISTAEFYSGGYAFLSQGPAPAPNSYEIGAALAVHSYKNTVVKIQYDYTARTDYHTHGAFIKVRHEWA